MLSTSIVLDDKSGDDVTYSLVQYLPNGARRLDPTTSLSLPGEMIIQHSVSGKAPALVDRHLVSFQRTVQSTGSPAVRAVLNITLSIPRDPAVTTQLIQDMVSNAADFLTDGAIASVATMDNLGALLRGES